jgi:hypothetical protein
MIAIDLGVKSGSSEARREEACKRTSLAGMLRSGSPASGLVFFQVRPNTPDHRERHPIPQAAMRPDRLAASIANGAGKCQHRSVTPTPKAPSMSAVAERFLAHLAVVLSLPGLGFNDDSVCCLFTPGELEVQMEWVPEGERLMVLAPVGRLSEDPTHARGLLWANFLFGGTRGETLSLEPDDDRVFLCRDIELGLLSVEQAIERFEAFIDTARQWQRRLEEAIPGVPVQPLQAMLKV